MHASKRELLERRRLVERKVAVHTRLRAIHGERLRFHNINYAVDSFVHGARTDYILCTYFRLTLYYVNVDSAHPYVRALLPVNGSGDLCRRLTIAVVTSGDRLLRAFASVGRLHC